MELLRAPGQVREPPALTIPTAHLCSKPLRHASNTAHLLGKLCWLCKQARGLMLRFRCVSSLLLKLFSESRSCNSSRVRGMGRYTAVHQNPEGEGDARPSALQIIEDEGYLGKLSDKTFLITGCSSGLVHKSYTSFWRCTVASCLCQSECMAVPDGSLTSGFTFQLCRSNFEVSDVPQSCCSGVATLSLY